MTDELDKLNELLKAQEQERPEAEAELRASAAVLKRGIYCLNCDKVLWSKHGRKLYCDEKCKDAMKYKKRRAREARFRTIERAIDGV